MTQLVGGRSQLSAEDRGLIDIDGNHAASVGSPVKTERRIGQSGQGRGSGVVVGVGQLDTVDPRAEDVRGDLGGINKSRDESELVSGNRAVSAQREAQVREQREDAGQATEVNEPVGSVVSVGEARSTQNQGNVPLDGFLVAHRDEQVNVQISYSIDRQVSSVGVRVDRVAEASSQATSNSVISAEFPVGASSGSGARRTTQETLTVGSAPTALLLSSASLAVSDASAFIVAGTGGKSEGVGNSQNVELSAERVGTNRDLTNTSLIGDGKGQRVSDGSVDILEDDTVGAEGFPSERNGNSSSVTRDRNTRRLSGVGLVPSAVTLDLEVVRTTISVSSVVGDEQVVGVGILRSFDASEVDQNTVFSVPSVPEGEEVSIGNGTDRAGLEDPRVKREFVTILNAEARERSGTSAVRADVARLASAAIVTANTVTRARVGALSTSGARRSSGTGLSGEDFGQTASTVVVDVGSNRNVTRSANVEAAVLPSDGELDLVDGETASSFSLSNEALEGSGQSGARIEITRRNLTRGGQRVGVVQEQELVPSDTLVLLSAETSDTESLAVLSVVDVNVGVVTTTTQTDVVGVKVTSGGDFNEDVTADEVVTSTRGTNTRASSDGSEGGVVDLLDEVVTVLADVEDVIVGTNSEGVVDGRTARSDVATLSQVPSTNRCVVGSNLEVFTARSQLPLTNNVRRIEADGALTGNVDGNVRVTSRRASTEDVTSVLNNPDSINE